VSVESGLDDRSKTSQQGMCLIPISARKVNFRFRGNPICKTKILFEWFPTRGDSSHIHQ